MSPISALPSVLWTIWHSFDCVSLPGRKPRQNRLVASTPRFPMLPASALPTGSNWFDIAAIGNSGPLQPCRSARRGASIPAECLTKTLDEMARVHDARRPGIAGRSRDNGTKLFARLFPSIPVPVSLTARMKSSPQEIASGALVELAFVDWDIRGRLRLAPMPFHHTAGIQDKVRKGVLRRTTKGRDLPQAAKQGGLARGARRRVPLRRGRRRSASFGQGGSSSSNSRLPRFTASRLLKSCATPRFSWPMASIFRERRSRSCIWG